MKSGNGTSAGTIAKGIVIGFLVIAGLMVLIGILSVPFGGV